MHVLAVTEGSGVFQDQGTGEDGAPFQPDRQDAAPSKRGPACNGKRAPCWDQGRQEIVLSRGPDGRDVVALHHRQADGEDRSSTVLRPPGLQGAPENLDRARIIYLKGLERLLNCRIDDRIARRIDVAGLFCPQADQIAAPKPVALPVVNHAGPRTAWSIAVADP